MRIDFSVDRRILNIAVPSIVSNVTVPLLGLCDVAIMGHVGGAAHIGAVTVGSMVFNVMYWLFAFLRMGTSGLTAQARGARQLDLTATLLRRSLLVALTIALAVIVMQVPLGMLAFWLMRPTDDVLHLATPYYYICIWGAPATLGLYTLTGWFIGMQNTRIPMMIAIGQNVVNIVASLLLVVVGGMGVKGVAVGTLVAQWTAFVAALWLLNRYYGRLLRRHVSSLNELLKGLGGFFRVNSFIFLRTLCLVVVNLYFTSAGASMGALVLAANALLMQLFMLFSYVMDGFAYAGEALAGRYYGARDNAMLRATVRHLFGWGFCVMLLFTAVYGVGGNTILSILTTDEAVVHTALSFYGWVLLVPLLGMAAFVWDGVCIGLTATRTMFMSVFLAAVVFFSIVVAGGLRSNHALWAAFDAYLAVRSLFLSLKWRFSRFFCCE